MPTVSPKRVTARVLALRVLRDVAKQQGFSNRWLSHHLERHPSMDPRDRGLATTLVYGVLRHRNRLDAHLDAHAHKPAGLRGELREILRIGAYELLELGRPIPIAVSEASKTLEQLHGRRAPVGVVQAVLGEVGRSAAEVDARLESGPLLDVLERRYSIPRWLAGRWIKHLGPERAQRRAVAVSGPPPVDLRIDLTRIGADEVRARLEAEHPGIAIETVPDQPQALRIRGGGDVFFGPLHDEGLISVQGLAAQRAVLWLDPRPGERVLDACAGMGVKTLQLAEHMRREGTLVAADVAARQLEGALQAHRRGALEGEPRLAWQVIEADLAEPHAELDAAPFDRVLLDVPCTGLGNLARHPEIRWHRRYEDLGDRVALQDALLRRNASRVRPGGVLVYAVCSPEPEEGPLRVRGVPDLELIDERTFTPEDDDTEGFYLAKLRRSEA